MIRFRRYLSTLLTVCLGLGLTVLVFALVQVWEQDRVQGEFEKRMEDASSALREGLAAYVEILHAIDSFYAGSVEVDRQEFHEFVQRALVRHPGVQALEWIPRVPDAARPAFEEAARRDGYPDFDFTQRVVQGQMGRASWRDEYFPVYYVEPYRGNEIALGFDLATNPARLEALQRARDTGEPAATERITLVQERDDQFGFLVFVPIYHNGSPRDTVEDRRRSLHGFALGVFRVGDVVATALKGVDAGEVELSLDDLTAPPDNRSLGRYVLHDREATASTDDEAAPSDAGRLWWSTVLEMGGRQWGLVFSARPGYAGHESTGLKWAILAAGLVLSGMLGAYLCSMVRHAATAKRLHAESERRRAETEALAELVRRGATQREPEPVVALICEHARGLLGADYAAVALTRPDGTRTWRGVTGNQSEAWRAHGGPWRGGPTARAIDEGRTVVAERLGENPEFPLAELPVHRGEGARTVLATPLCGGTGPGGALVLGWRRDVSLRAAQVRLCEALAGYAAIILENARAHEALAARAAELAASEALLADEQRVLELIALGAPLPTVLEALARSIEEQSEDMLCSILLLDPDGAHLRVGAAPSLPPDYHRAVDGLAVGPSAGSCGTAAYRKETVIVSDIATDPLWSEGRALALGLGLRACWSTPIPSSNSHVLGTFAMYFREPRGPGARDRQLLDVATRLAGIAIGRNEREAALEHQALHDVLTGLPNRSLLHDRLHQALLLAERNNTALALLVIDLDRFKEINDTLGHHYGDELLRQVGQRLLSRLRASDTIARLGGDEFAVVLPTAHLEGAAQVARELVHALEQPFQVEGHSLAVEASIGVAAYPQHGQDAQTLLRRADIAMYQAKRGASDYAVYSAEQDRFSPDRLALAGELRRAVEHDELRLHYQPKVELRSRRVLGAEALVRWQHPRRGLLPPDQFLPLAEETGLIKTLDWWALSTALRQCSSWRQAGVEMAVAVNLSMRSLHDAGLPDTVAELLATWSVPARLLTLEVTEGSLMTERQRVSQALKRLRAIGVRIAIDDFGTGYSSLGYLKGLPADELKIDQTFVRAMAVEARDRPIVEAVVKLGHSVGLEVLAEGVEDQPTWEQLVELGCDAAQGYHLSRPLPAGELLAWLERWEAAAPKAALRVPNVFPRRAGGARGSPGLGAARPAQLPG